MSLITIDTIPKSFLKIFGQSPKDPQIYEIWINNIWNVWLVNTSEKEKYKYRYLDKNTINKFSNNSLNLFRDK